MALRFARRASPLLACGLLFMLRAASAFDVVRAPPGMEAGHRFAFASKFALTAFVAITANIACCTLSGLLLDSGGISINTSPSLPYTAGEIDVFLLADLWDPHSENIKHILSPESSVIRVADGDTTVAAAAAAANGQRGGRTSKAHRVWRSAVAASAVHGGAPAFVPTTLSASVVNDFEEVLVAQRVLMVMETPVDQHQKNRTNDNATTGDSSAEDFSWLWGPADGDSFASRAFSAYSVALETWRWMSAWARSGLHDTHVGLCSSSQGAGGICDTAGDASSATLTSLAEDLCMITSGPGCPHFIFPNITFPLLTECVRDLHEVDVPGTPCNTSTIPPFLLFYASILTILGVVIICGYLGLVGTSRPARGRRRRLQRLASAFGHARRGFRLTATFYLEGFRGVLPFSDITSSPPSDADDITLKREIENARRILSAPHEAIPTLPESLSLLDTLRRLSAVDTGETSSPAQPLTTLLVRTLRGKLSQMVDRRVMEAWGATTRTGSGQGSRSPSGIALSHAAGKVESVSTALDVLDLAAAVPVATLPPVEQAVASLDRADGARAAMNIAVIDSAAAAAADDKSATDVACPNAYLEPPHRAVSIADVGERATCDRTCDETCELGKEDPPQSTPIPLLAASPIDCAGAPTDMRDDDVGGMVDRVRAMPTVARTAVRPPCAASASTADVVRPGGPMSGNQKNTKRLMGPPRYVTPRFSFAAAVKGLPSPPDIAGAGVVMPEADSACPAPQPTAADKTGAAADIGKSSGPEPEPPAGSRRLRRWRGRGTRGGKKRNKKKGKAGGEQNGKDVAERLVV